VETAVSEIVSIKALSLQEITMSILTEYETDVVVGFICLVIPL
jgi:hypothetical protein